ncbi:MAG: hypothetical protein ACF8NJ_05045 [Phycisphaerales bacterium JB038]
MRCLCCWHKREVRHALEPPAWLLALTKRKHAVLPYRPYWPALIFDTVFYAALWSFFLIAPRAARGAVRRLRHRCPRCGYDTRRCRKPGCPECGWRRGAAAQREQAT